MSNRWVKANSISDQYCRPLWNAGFQAYLVGGCVRDLMLGLDPKDYDIATSALPNDILQVFYPAHKCKYISAAQAYPVVQVDGLEIATFRKDGTNRQDASGIQVGATIDEDAQRRDFTVNALYYYHGYYNHDVLDPTGRGLEDLVALNLAFVGDPMQRINEDPVRCLRAVRFALKLGFSLEPETQKALASVQLGYSNKGA